MTAEELRERYARQSTCAHPWLTADLVDRLNHQAARLADSDQTWVTCPDCGRTGYAEFDRDDQPVLVDEPRAVPG